MNLTAQKTDKPRAAAPIRNVAYVDLARAFRSSPSICGSVPTPAEAYLSTPGCDFASLIRSATELAEHGRMDGQDFSGFRETGNRHECVRPVTSILVDQRRMTKCTRRAHQHRMAVRLRGHD